MFSRHLAVTFLSIAILSCCGIVVANEASLPTAQAPETAVNKPQQWRCVWTESPDTTALISWNTTQPGKSHRVLLQPAGDDKEPTEKAKQTVVAAQRNAAYSSKEIKLYYHHVRLTNLTPNTVYEIILESDGAQSPQLSFKTAPDDDRPLAVLFGADSRSGLKERKLMNAMLARMATESRQDGKTPIVAFAHGGDYIRDGNRLDQWSQWMTDHEITTSADGHLLPIIPARGNHDHGRLYNEIFGFPAKHPDYYAISIGAQLRWITLNTETSNAGNQRKWLEKELAAARPKNRWVIAQYHTPAYPAVKVPSGALLHWVPLFEQYNVDLVCEGDGHNIKRTPPIRHNKIDPTGVVYIGEGGLGVGQRTPKTDRWYLREPHGKAGKGHHVQLLSFEGDTLTYRAVLLDERQGSKLFDEHRLQARPAEQRKGK